MLPTSSLAYNGSEKWSTTNNKHRLPEETMGRTLHNTIYLGRGPLYDSRWAPLALALGGAAGAGLGWLAVRALR